MKKETLIAALASVAIIEFFMIIIMLGLITPTLIIMLLIAMGILFPMTITRYTGGFIFLFLTERHSWSDKGKSILMNTCLIIGSVAAIFFLKHAFETSTNDPVDLNRYFSIKEAIAVSIIGSIIGLVMARKTELMRQFMGFF